MNSRLFRRFTNCLLALSIAGCAQSASGIPAVAPFTPQEKTAAKTQYLYVYNAGSPGQYSGEYTRYSLTDLSVQEKTAATGLGGSQAFDKSGSPYFVDEASQGGGFAVYLQPIAKGSVPAQQQFAGVPCQSASLSIGPTGHFFVAQYCSANVLEYTGGFSKKPKKPIAKYTGGNLGVSGVTNPTYAITDRKGDLYVGDNGGGVTYFRAGSKKGSVAFATGHGGYVNQMILDRNGDVWSIHGPNPSAVYFADKKTCVPAPSGPVVRNEMGERFSSGKLVQQIYTAETSTPLFSDNGLSIASDSKGRIYTGSQNSDIKGVVLDFDPGNSCPNDALSFQVGMSANPQVAVDAERELFVSNYHANTLAIYGEAKVHPKKTITQKKGLVAITYTVVGP